MSELGDYLRPLRGDMSLREASERSHGRISHAAITQAEVMHYLGHKNMQMAFDYTRATEQSSLKVFKNFHEINKKPVKPDDTPKHDKNWGTK